MNVATLFKIGSQQYKGILFHKAATVELNICVDSLIDCVHPADQYNVLPSLAGLGNWWLTCFPEANYKLLFIINKLISFVLSFCVSDASFSSWPSWENKPWSMQSFDKQYL